MSRPSFSIGIEEEYQTIDPETRDIVQNVYIRKVEKVNGELYSIEFETYPAVKDPMKPGGAK